MVGWGPVRRATRTALIALVVLAGACGLGAATASAAVTEVNLEGLPAGTELTNQVQSEGIEFGKAAQFGQKSPAGDCGAPTVKDEAPLSPPKYLELAQCSGGLSVSGTYGALTGHPRGSLSLNVREFGAGPPAQVTLTTYDASGNVLASGHVTASPSSWEALSATQEGGKEEPVSYFSIASAVTGNHIVIDEIQFEASEGGGTTTTSTSPTPPPPPPPPAPPTAVLSLLTPNPASAQVITMSGAGSQAGGGHIISYDWDLKGNGKITTSTGTNPIVHLILAPGVHTIGLKVTNSEGQSSTTTSKFGVSQLPSLQITLPDGGEGPCETTIELGPSRFIGECIQKLKGGGYVIETRQLAYDGMVLVPKQGGIGVYRIQIATNIASVAGGYVAALSGTPSNIELLNTPIGNMVLGGMDLQAEPLHLPPWGGHGPLQIHLARTGGAGAHSAETKPPPLAGVTKTLLVAFGVGRECTASETAKENNESRNLGKEIEEGKRTTLGARTTPTEAGPSKSSCCPPSSSNSGLSSGGCAQLPGNFPLTGQIAIYLTNTGGAIFNAQVGLNLGEVFQATGAIEFSAEPESGINLDSLMFAIPEANLADIFEVKKASFVYYFPSAPEESKRDTWQAKGEITFGPLGEPALEAELAFKKGKFHAGKLVFVAPPPGIPVFTGVFLNKLGGSVGSEPFSFGGILGAKIAGTLELTLEFKYQETSFKENEKTHAQEEVLGFFGGQGVLELGNQKIATLGADVYSDGYIDAALKIELSLPSPQNTVVSVGGKIGFWDETASGKWQAEGSVFLKIWVIDAEVAGLVNNEYIAGCAGVDGFGVQGRYKLEAPEAGSIGGGFYAFSSCTDQLARYKEKPLREHTGGFVGGSSLRAPRVGTSGSGPSWRRGGSRRVTGTAASVEEHTFTLPSGKPAQELRFTASSGTPVVTLIGPGGQTYTTPLSPGQIATSGQQFIAAVAPDGNQVIVMLRNAQGGTWGVRTPPSSPAISRVEVAEDEPPATVKVKVAHRHGSWGLNYRIGHFVPGTAVRFVERGSDSTHVLGTVRRPSGTLRFVPQVALGRTRRIVAYLLSAEGVPQRVLTVGSYSAPAPARGGRVPRLRITRHGLTAVVTWGAAPNARMYRVKVRGSDGRLVTVLRGRGSRSVRLTSVLPFESFTASVTAQGGPELLSGPAARARLAAVRTTRRPSSRRHSTRRK